MSNHKSLDSQLPELWNICDDEDGFEIHLGVDMWWGIRLKCSHGEYTGMSNNYSDPGRGMERAIRAAKRAHEPNIEFTKEA